MTTRSISELMADPEFLDHLAESVSQELAARRREREEFEASETFQRMLSALRDNPRPIRVDSEEISYQADRVKAEIGWEFATKDEVQMFFNIVASPNAETVEPGSVTEDEDCMFDNCSFNHYGLHVWMMSGQGTAISIYNAAAVRQTAAEKENAA